MGGTHPDKQWQLHQKPTMFLLRHHLPTNTSGKVNTDHSEDSVEIHPSGLRELHGTKCPLLTAFLTISL